MPRPQRLVRRQPLSERLKAKLNPFDFLLWLSEEIETRDWDSKSIGIQIGLAANFVFLLARANSGASSTVDDVFGDSQGASWGSFFVCCIYAQAARYRLLIASDQVQPLVWLMVSASGLNAVYTMTRSRHYRLFEANVEAGPSTPSAHRVRVDSSPVSSSPLRLLSDIIGSDTAESRAHPDKTRDVWEISVWDPLPLSMQLFCLFSPGHVLVYMLFLPLAPLDPRPSVTVFNCLLLQVMLSAQLLLLHTRYSQQNKDTAVIQKEVMHEYDSKYVHPRLHPVVREVGTQFSMSEEGLEREEVELGTPSTLIRRGFHTNPNPNYAKHFDPDHNSTPVPRNLMSPSLFTPATKPRYSDSFTSSTQKLRSPGPRQSLPPSATSTFSTGVSVPTPAPAPVPTNAGTNFGGSLGVYTHANSPLKKATSMGDMKSPGVSSPRNSREMAALEQRAAAERFMRQGSPLKENRRATGPPGQQQSANPFARAKPARFDQERFPSLWSYDSGHK